MIAQAKAGKPSQFDYLCIHPYEVIEGIKDPFGEIPYLWMTHYLRDALQASVPISATPRSGSPRSAPPSANSDADAAAKVAVKSYVLATPRASSTPCGSKPRTPSVNKPASVSSINPAHLAPPSPPSRR